MGNPKCLLNCPQIKKSKKSFCNCNSELRCCDCARQGKCKWCINYDSKIKASVGKCVPLSEYNSTNCPPSLQGYDRCSTLEYFSNKSNYLFYVLLLIFIIIIILKFNLIHKLKKIFN